MANPPTIRATLFRYPNRAYECLDFGAFQSPRYRTGNDSENRPFLAAIMDQNSGTVNPQRLVRNFRAILGKSWTIHHQSGRPSSWALVAAKDASFFGLF